jgi:hypothetical protein
VNTRMRAFIAIVGVVHPTTQMGMLASGHSLYESMTAAGVACLVATEVAVRLFGGNGGSTPPAVGHPPAA